ncbi:uncharacterized protein LOC124154556 [Ischnura elegans]|uniref:uncharacterized protein LOC124154556 n=1 Tax=Ischnura elegans TaxID=197161 RepID=UPI001ED877A2|nr:uncharacterized protein LOC124154556 [Ischnura elegans]XP_046384325.1 uncharacterized protein LOC124154556 [Ischnura elegans]
MTLLRTVFVINCSITPLGRMSVQRSVTPFKTIASPRPACAIFQSWTPLRNYTVSHLTKAMDLITPGKEKISLIAEVNEKEPKVGLQRKLVLANPPPGKSLVVLLPWLLSRPKHIQKFAKLYLDYGFDVLTVRLTPWQLLWPVKGSQVVAGELVSFLHYNQSYSTLFLHGFSIGGYLWGEALRYIVDDKEGRYKPILDRIVGHVWDSAADMQDIPIGFSRAMFPTNAVLRAGLERYTRYHLKTFHDAATCHYIRSSQMFHNALVRSPSLFLLSKADPVGTVESNMSVKMDWEALGVKVYVKCWEDSAHVCHFVQHQKEYISELNLFLASLGLITQAEKAQAKL